MLKEIHAARPVSGSVASAPRPVLRLEQLSKTFGGTRALRDDALEIAPGEIHALVGQNGCGKSTLIKTLPVITTPTRRARPADGEPLTSPAVTDARHDRLRFVHRTSVS
jgi:ribose transport system ATP-binding protein